MPLRMKITPITLYNEDQSIFDGLIENLPSRPFVRSAYYDDLFLTGWDIDSDTLINNILIETGDMNVLYTEPDFFKFAVTAWAQKEKAVWQNLFETLFFKYNPIWNKDGSLKNNATETRALLNGLTVTKSTKNDRTTTENENILDYDNTTETIDNATETERVETPDLTDTTTGNTTQNNTSNGGNQTTETTTNTGTQTDVKTDSTEEKVAAFNETNYTNRNKTDTTINDTRTDNLTENKNTNSVNSNSENKSENVTETIEHMGTNTISETVEQDGTNTTNRDYSRERSVTGSIGDIGTESITNSGNDSGTVKNDVVQLEQGNIGVTTTQTMIEEERRIVQFNIYDKIIQDFKVNFCILIY